MSPDVAAFSTMAEFGFIGRLSTPTARPVVLALLPPPEWKPGLDDRWHHSGLHRATIHGIHNPAARPARRTRETDTLRLKD
jgi:hypothetical protein